MDIVEIPSWLEGLPLAPEYRPTDTEFADPIAYISKIEKEASAFGICKIIPPILKPSRKYVFYNLNKSLAKCPELGPDVDVSSICSTSDGGRGGELKGFFTTRQQELGQSVRKSRGGGDDHGHGLAFGVNKQVWQSGEVYTLERFELKSKAFAKSVLAGVRDVSPLAVEALFWKAANEEPIYVEYANDVPGSAFGEPGSTSRYFHRRRRRKDYSNGMKNEMESTVRNCNDIVANDVVGEHGDASIMPLSSPVDGDLLHSRNKSSSTCKEMEGTAGWKLSNSPWNLQVIARSPGSLTRFMPDDIPGVTSPMVYIGMLFSWFAWHVEDHELHSMNFLHTGSQKTWYAVPGDYAFSFEEVLRMKGYGGDIDHLAALKSLGEKTTLLSPEILLASGLPCCRLIQNPGEFVVTFPRAYHVGFSHGFNCGEAANFGTPQWLNIAKEAAVRRAAMSYLPMLSHQQLLYLLSMSFILRVPRSLLPGARSSRLRNRHKLERELLVKKAFIDDILNENHLLSNLLRRGSGYHSVLWHPDLLPSLYKEPLGPTGAASTSREDETENNIEKEKTQCDFSSGTGLYVQPPNALYEDDDDDLCDFQINSGTLPCVACGILGYPFMCVVQPSERASTELLPTDSPVNNEVPEISVHKPSAHQLENTEDAPSGSDICTFSKDLTVPSVTNFANCWNTSNRYLRPRIFCLEHALQVEELLLPRGGANMLIICHSDYLKMKAHAMTVAEEIGRPFKYNEVSLPSASREELNLIDLSIEDEEHYNCGEDWTAKLGINLRYCLKVNNESPSKHVNNALALAGLFSNRCPGLDFYTVKWISRRPRSKVKLNCSVTRNPTKFSSEERDANSGRSSEGIVERKGDEMIKYSRKKHRINYDSSEVANRYPGFLASNMLKRSLSAVHRDCNKEELCLLVRNGSFQVQRESQIAENTNARGEDSHNVKILVHSGRQSNTMPDGDAPMIEVCDGDSGKVGVHAAVRSSNVQIDEVAEKFCIENEDHDSVTWKVQQKTENVQSSYDGEVISGTNSVPKFCISVPLTCNVAQEKENTESEGNLYEPDNNCVCAPVSSALSSGLLSEASSEVHMSTGMGLNVESKDETHMVNGCNEEKLPIGDVTQKNQIAMDMVNSQVPSEDHKLSENVQAISERNGENTSICDEYMNQPASASMGQFSDVRLENRTIENLDNDIEVCSQDEKEVERREHSPLDSRSNEVKERKRKKVEQKTINKVECNGYVRSPCEGLRPRTRKVSSQVDIHKINESLASASKKARKSCASSDHHSETEEHAKRIYRCELEGCRMICKTKSELQLHRNNRCTVKGCGKRFNSHKYAMRHQRVHDDERPLKCPWEGCSMSFKWAWARTEHIRVHTGERPYLCKFEGCGRSFRFVSDFSRHRRKSGHYVNPSSG